MYGHESKLIEKSKIISKFPRPSPYPYFQGTLEAGLAVRTRATQPGGRTYWRGGISPIAGDLTAEGGVLEAGLAVRTRVAAWGCIYQTQGHWPDHEHVAGGGSHNFTLIVSIHL
jgi:hypothetical protein